MSLAGIHPSGFPLKACGNDSKKFRSQSIFGIDILNAARLTQTFVAEVDKASFEQDLLRQSAVIRQIEVMGEATKRLSSSFRANHPETPWSKIAGMRDILIHAYDRVDLDEVWTTIQVAIPDLISQLEQLVPPDG